MLRAAQKEGFNVLLTGDQTLSDEQNLAVRTLAVVALSFIKWRILRNYLPRIMQAITEAKMGLVTQVDCGTFSRRSNGT